MTEVTTALGLTTEQVERVLTSASLAPSVHNTQPWRFKIAPDRIELHPDTSRALSATDPETRELRLSCGAALYNLRLALQSTGVRPLVTMLPGKDAPGALAVVRRGGTIKIDDEGRRLLGAVPHRRTNRRPFLDAPVDPRQRHVLVRAAELERSWLHVVTTPEDRAQLQQLVHRAHEIQLADRAVQAELAAYTGHRPGTGDGVPPASTGVRPAMQDEWAFRDFQGSERHLGKDCESDPLVVVLCSHYDSPLGDLQAGQAMQRVLLTATVHGLSASFLSQPIEVPRVREDLRRALGGVLVPQTVLRIGYSTPVPPTPRRPVSELLMDSGEHVLR
ncbi:nitroreductase family protein [Lentzea sp. NPDC004782]|uniref:Acg family FMN-binding oxidoreductase n=1 Tax=Lentzea sp. NPDC004782 TaxID=3154458 RepID=UPI0033A1E6B1